MLQGCGTNVSRETDAKVSNAKEKIKDAAGATGEAAKALRDDYARAMTKRLAELDAKVDDLKNRAAKADEQTRKGLQSQLEDAKVKRDAAMKKLDELKAASVDRWEKIKDGVGNAFDDLKKSFD